MDEIRFTIGQNLSSDWVRFRASRHTLGFNQVMVWCLEQFGPVQEGSIGGSKEVRRWDSDGHMNIWVRCQVDAAAFRLRWC